MQAAEATQQQALFGYQKAVQEAFREVNDALVNQYQTGEQLLAQRRQIQSLEQYSETARLRYDNGYTSLIEVLDAERSLQRSTATHPDPADATAGHGQSVQGHGRRLGSGSG